MRGMGFYTARVKKDFVKATESWSWTVNVSESVSVQKASTVITIPKKGSTIVSYHIDWTIILIFT